MQITKRPSRGGGDILEAAIAKISIKQLLLFVMRIAARSIDLSRQVAVCHENIAPSVVIEIKERNTPSHVRSRPAQASVKHMVGESTVAVVSIKVRAVIGEV